MDRCTKSSNSFLRAHDCRPDGIKYRIRNKAFDTLILSEGLIQTKLSLIEFYENFLYDKTNTSSSRASTANSSSLFELGKSKESNEKLLKEIEPTDCDQSDDLNWPKSITCTRYGDIILCDKANHRLIVYNRDLIFKYMLGCKGSLDGQFDEPFDVAISAINDLLVADKNNYRIQIFDEEFVVRKNRAKINAFDKYTNGDTKTRTQFKYKRSIVLDNQPVKVFASTHNSIFGVATIVGTIYIFNTSYRIISILQFEGKFDTIDLKNLFINKNGDGLVSMKYENDRLMLKNYSFYSLKKRQSTKPLLKYRNSDLGQRTKEKVSESPVTIKANVMELVREVEIQKAYCPGVCIERALCMTQTPDFNNLIVYDPKNLCVLMYDLDGKFVKIVFRAYDRLKHIVAMCFSPEGHFITCEYEIKECTQRTLNEFTRTITSLSRKYIFKIRMYRYADCDCHRNMPVKIKVDAKRLQLIQIPKTVRYNSFYL